MTLGVNPKLTQPGERLIDAVRRIAAECTVSERTARRYLMRGELPRVEPFTGTLGDGTKIKWTARCIGSDGKSYPRDHKSKNPKTALSPTLALARHALRSLEKKASEHGFYPRDLKEVCALAKEAARIAQKFIDSENGK